MRFHYRYEHRIFLEKKATQSVYFAARYDCRVPLSEYAEHAVRSHAMRMVFVLFRITPSCRSLALQGKPGDVAMGGVYVLVHPPQPCHAPPSTSRICRRSYIKMAIILPMTAAKMVYPKMILCCNGIRFFFIRITSYSKCNFLPRQTLQARPATRLNKIFLSFFSQQMEEHTTLPPFFIRILS